MQAGIAFPFGPPNEAEISASVVECPKCRGPAIVRDGLHDFRKQIERLVRNSNINRKQAVRFIKKIEDAKDLSTLPVSAEAINSDLVEIAKLALQQKEPKGAFKQVCSILREIIVVGSTLAMGLAAGTAVYDRHSNEALPNAEQRINSDGREHEAEQKPSSEEEKPPEKPLPNDR
ncbi:hypothetical protein N8I71_12055 [Roseibacterium sp. SDUM158016]|uniref:hypothetical protein n=1 Tax=Roseicyclus sediminis TaxID=2980997 RepID=UPI0021D3385A|nr:hypothetical protein [Roseibacterium sp. SDUM158016]MCU4653568.1 hypothetical protein [Roseibacterium sp. SDUM158016]